MYLHGVDLRDASRTPRFHETMHTRVQTRLDVEFASVIEPSFRHASEVLRTRGVRARNLSRNSALGNDIFPKIDWRSLGGHSPDLVASTGTVASEKDQRKVAT